jgi:hypothetical protein
LSQAQCGSALRPPSPLSSAASAPPHSLPCTALPTRLSTSPFPLSPSSAALRGSADRKGSVSHYRKASPVSSHAKPQKYPPIALHNRNAYLILYKDNITVCCFQGL